MRRFNGDTDGSNDDVDGGGVYGVAIPVSTTEDQFQQCSTGASPLFNTSNFALANAEMDGQGGSSHYGAVTISSETTAEQLSYNVLINGSAIHGAGIYVNLVHEAFLQVMTHIFSHFTHTITITLTYSLLLTHTLTDTRSHHFHTHSLTHTQTPLTSLTLTQSLTNVTHSHVVGLDWKRQGKYRCQQLSIAQDLESG